MHPYLFKLQIGTYLLRPPTYGVCLAIAFSAAYFESLRRAAKLGEDTRHIENLFLIIVISSVIGARMFHVLFEEPAYYFANPGKILAVWEGGYTFHGALILSMINLSLYCYFKKISPLQFLDIAAPPTLIGLFVGRLGCFFAGCCWGSPTNLPWGVTFQHPETFAVLKNVPLHPTQLYESFGSLILFLLMLWKFRTRQYRGQILFLSMIGYGILRFSIEFVRADEIRGFVFGHTLSYAQVVSIGLVSLGIAGIIYFKDKGIPTQ